MRAGPSPPRMLCTATRTAGVIALNLRSICRQDGLQKTLTLNLQPGQECGNMGKIVFGMMQSLDDGYVAGVEGELEPPLHSPPGIALFRYWIDHVRDVAGSLYGRRMYEVMRFWEADRPEWDATEHEFAAAWRAQPKWVAS